MRIITISREFGSGGRELGKRLAEELDFAYYDKEILSMISERMQMDEDYIEKELNKSITITYPYTIRRSFYQTPSQVNQVSKLLAEQNKIICSLAEKEDCIIVGRGADAILREHDPFSLFIYADQASKVARCRSRAHKAVSYTHLDVYKRQAMSHAGYALNVFVRIHWIDSETISEENVQEIFHGLHGIIVPGGFGNRGIEGMLLSAKYARENNLPYFGICLGMQIAVIEFARDVAGLSDAHSGEFDEQCADKVIDFMPGQSNEIDKGGTLRLGSYPCVIRPGTQMEKCYGSDVIRERHRHRYEFNNEYREKLTVAGLVLSGTSPDNRLVETVELPEHPFFVGVQFHPEFKSRPNQAHPLFKGFISAALKQACEKKE